MVRERETKRESACTCMWVCVCVCAAMHAHFLMLHLNVQVAGIEGRIRKQYVSFVACVYTSRLEMCTHVVNVFVTKTHAD